MVMSQTACIHVTLPVHNEEVMLERSIEHTIAYCEYLAEMRSDVKRRPLYVVQDELQSNVMLANTETRNVSHTRNGQRRSHGRLSARGHNPQARQRVAMVRATRVPPPLRGRGRGVAIECGARRFFFAE